MMNLHVAAPRRHRLGLARALVAALAVSLPLLASAPASATVGHSYTDQFGGPGGADGQFTGGPAGIAVLEPSGDVFVSDQGDGTSSPRIQRFDASGAFVSAFAIDGAAYGSPGPLAIDPTGAGAIYVGAIDNGTGTATAVKYSLTGTFAHTLDPTGSGTTVNYGAIAVDPADGTVYAPAIDTTTSAQVIDSFDPATGAFLASFDGSAGSPDGAVLCPTGLAVDGAHRLYVLDPCKNRVDRYTAAGAYVATVDDGSRGGPLAVAVDPVSGEVLAGESGPAGPQITEFTAGGAAPEQTTGAANVANLQALAVGHASGTIYVADNAAAFVDRFTTFVGPTVTTDAATAVTTTSATLNGTVDPGGTAATYHFEYGTSTSYGLTTPETDAGSAADPVAAKAAVTGLTRNTTYHYRIVGSNGTGSITGGDQTLTTVAAPPAIGSPAFASAITPSSARIHGTINPEHSATTFHIDYGLTTGYGATAPQPDGDAGDGVTDQAVVASLAGLTPNTTYHFRVTADNGTGGAQHGADGTFTTPPDAAAGATGVTATKATLSGTVGPRGTATTYHFNYGPTTAYGASTPEADAGTGPGDTVLTEAVAGLAPSTTYHVQVVTTTGGVASSGADGSFTTAPAPAAIAAGATGVTTSAATLTGTADTHGVAGTYRFEVASPDGTLVTTTDARPLAGADGAQPVTAAVSGLAAGTAFRVRLVVDSDDATDFSDAVSFATASPPAVVPPPPDIAWFGCAAPRLNAYDKSPRPGDTIMITGADLGVGGTVAFGAHSSTPIRWGATGFAVEVPGDATGTLPLTVNCGRVSNTIGVAIHQDPSNAFTITKSAVAGSVATLSVKVPGSGRIATSGDGTRAGTASIAKAGTATVRVRLSAAGAKALRASKRGTLSVAVRVRFTPTGGQAASKTKSITFKRKAGH